MNRTGMTVLCSILLLNIFFCLAEPVRLHASTPPVPCSPPERVVDLADIIEPALEGQLVAALRELEEKTTAQMVILTVTSLDGEAIESFSLHVAEQWKPGQKGKDNGLLLTVALKERKYRFETGYRLESVLPDSLLGSIGREKMGPFFKEGQYGEGIAAATKEILALLAKHDQAQLSGAEKIPQYKSFTFKIFSFSSPLLTPVISILLFILIFTSIIFIAISWRKDIASILFFVSSVFLTSPAFTVLSILSVIAISIGHFKGWIKSGGDWISFKSSSSSDNSFSGGGGGKVGGGGSSGSW